MDKIQKHDYMVTIEQYLEDNQVYELFEELLKSLIVNRPEKPLDFIIDALNHPKCKLKIIIR
jgi:adenylate kinase